MPERGASEELTGYGTGPVPVGPTGAVEFTVAPYPTGPVPVGKLGIELDVE